MADILRRQLFCRAPRMLSIAHEVYKELCRRDDTTRDSAISRLELELGTWQADIDAHKSYKVALAEYHAARAVWHHVGSLSKEPESPTWPANLPQFGRIDLLFSSLADLKWDASRLRGIIEKSRPVHELDAYLQTMATSIGIMGQVVDEIKPHDAAPILEETSSLPEQPRIKKEQTEITAPADDLTPRERTTLEALGQKTMQAQELAEAAGYPNNSSFRTMLSNLVKRKHLKKCPDGGGYLRY